MIVIGVLVLAGVLWIGGELHYRGCVDAAEAAHPATVAGRSSILDSDNIFDDAGRSEPTEKPNPERARAVRGCSRLPF